MEQRLKQSNVEWSDLDLCLFVSTRIATLLKQISAYHITVDCQFDIEIIQERLSIFGETFDEEQRELLDLLATLTESISDGDIASVIDEVISAAKENLEQIQRLCWTGNSELAKDAEKAIKSTTDKEEGMRALIVGLVHEIISLFGPGLNELILLIQQEFPSVFDWESIQALENIWELHNAVVSRRTDFEAQERTHFKEYYSVDIVSKVDFQCYFPFQPHKVQEYMEMKVTVKALSDLLHSHNQLIHVLAVKEALLADERSNLANEEVTIAEEKAELDRERAEISAQIVKIKREKATLSKENAQLRAEKVKAADDMLIKKKKSDKAYADLAAKSRSLELKLEELSVEKMEAHNTIDRLKNERDYLKRKFEDLELEDVRRSVGELIVNSKSLVLGFKHSQISPVQLMEEYDSLDTHLTDIDRIVKKLGAERMMQHPWDDPADERCYAKQ